MDGRSNVGEAAGPCNGQGLGVQGCLAQLWRKDHHHSLGDSTARISTFKISDQPGNEATGLDQLPAPSVQVRKYIAIRKEQGNASDRVDYFEPESPYLSSLRRVSPPIQDVIYM